MTRMHLTGCAALLAAALASPQAAAAEAEAKGTIVYKSKAGPVTVAVKRAVFVRGPDPVDPSRTIRRIVLSTADVSGKLRACGTMMCSDGGIEEGMTVDLDAGPRLNYWMVANGQRIQYSGTEAPASLKLATDTPTRLAGKLAFDGSGAGGPKVDVDFDAPLVREIKAAR